MLDILNNSLIVICLVILVGGSPVGALVWWIWIKVQEKQQEKEAKAFNDGFETGLSRQNKNLEDSLDHANKKNEEIREQHRKRLKRLKEEIQGLKEQLNDVESARISELESESYEQARLIDCLRDERSEEYYRQSEELEQYKSACIEFRKRQQKNLKEIILLRTRLEAAGLTTD